MINDQPPIPPLRQLCDERCAGGLAVTACYTTKWDVIQDDVIKFLDGAFTYYSSLYIKALNRFDPEANSAFSLNYLNDIDGAFMLLMSCCVEGDAEEPEKIELIPTELDRAFSLLQLQSAYDSNSFQEILYKISSEIRGVGKGEVRPVFDKYIKEEISKHRMTEADVPFKYIFFKNAGIGLNTRFKRYFFARVEEFLAKGMNLNMKHTLSDFVSKTGVKTGFHIEHILAHNAENLGKFDGDEDKFEQERNRLGAILLLKGKDNISSNNEVYAEKLKSYANTLYWNETLREDSYKSKLDMKKLKSDYNLELEPLNSFGVKDIEARQALLFKIASIVWI
ncbi:MAG: HNH endonuclease family protein [bacterium]